MTTEDAKEIKELDAKSDFRNVRRPVDSEIASDFQVSAALPLINFGRNAQERPKGAPGCFACEVNPTGETLLREKESLRSLQEVPCDLSKHPSVRFESLGGSAAVAKASNAGETTKESRRSFAPPPALNITDICMDFFRKEDVQRYAKDIVRPVVNVIYNQIYPYIWTICLYSVFLFFLTLVNLILLVRIQYFIVSLHTFPLNIDPKKVFG
jgi:hypothetical protein